MKVTVSVAMSLDGFIDNLSEKRLMLSSAEDWAEVKALRADHDAILVGAETVRRDNPALVTRNDRLIHKRLESGRPADPVKVTLTTTGNLSSSLRFFSEGKGEKIVIAAASADPDRLSELSSVATIIHSDYDHLSVPEILKILSERGIHSLFVEGGMHILTEFLEADAVDHLRVAVAPFFVGEPDAPRFVEAVKFPYDYQNRMTLSNVNRAGDMAVLHYIVKAIDAPANGTGGQKKFLSPAYPTDFFMLREAIKLAQECPKSYTAYSVGAVIVTADGRIYTGYSRETAPDNHAEEEAILKALAADATLEGAVIYSSMEPCSTRKSKSKSCSDLIIEQRMNRVVFATYEPANFVACNGHRLLHDHNIEVVVIPELASEALAVNGHILDKK